MCTPSWLQRFPALAPCPPHTPLTFWVHLMPPILSARRSSPLATKHQDVHDVPSIHHGLQRRFGRNSYHDSSTAYHHLEEKQDLSAQRVDMFHATIKLFEQSTKQRDTDPDLRDCFFDYAIGWDRVRSKEEICLANWYNKNIISLFSESPHDGSHPIVAIHYPPPPTR